MDEREISRTPAYKKAFNEYLRRGTPIEWSLQQAAAWGELSLKADFPEHPTTHYIWRTRGDNKVRASHATNNGKVFAWDNPPPTGHPGEDYGCRCLAEPFYGYEINDPPIEEVYPELLLLPWLHIPRILNAWRIWIFNRRENTEWRLGAHKSQKRWANQIEKRDWTPEQITETIKYGKRYKAPNLPRKHDPSATATRYEYNSRFVVRDDQTGEILQVSDKDFIPRDFP